MNFKITKKEKHATYFTPKVDIEHNNLVTFVTLGMHRENAIHDEFRRKKNKFEKSLITIYDELKEFQLLMVKNFYEGCFASYNP